MYILNPRYVMIKSSWWRRLMGYSHQIILSYAEERENINTRYSIGFTECRGFYTTEDQAKERLEELEANPEWTR